MKIDKKSAEILIIVDVNIIRFRSEKVKKKARNLIVIGLMI